MRVFRYCSLLKVRGERKEKGEKGHKSKKTRIKAKTVTAEGPEESKKGSSSRFWNGIGGLKQKIKREVTACSNECCGYSRLWFSCDHQPQMPLLIFTLRKESLLMDDAERYVLKALLLRANESHGYTKLKIPRTYDGPEPMNLSC